jgi:catechol 2,3-dioxygenase-like lactoylglutathione lyase family enzyme
MLIRIWIERSRPLAGTAAIEGSEPLRFEGWLELLRAVSELVAASAGGDEGTAKGTDVTPRTGRNGHTREGRTMRIGLTTLYVDDQDKAERFYTEVLGLRIKTNAPYGPGERWLSMVSPEEPDGVELSLHLADEAARAFQASRRQQGRPMLALHTPDCEGEAERLKARGVVFIKEPTKMSYGGIDAVFDDTCGNLLDLHQT